MKVVFLDVDGILNTHKYTLKTRDDKTIDLKGDRYGEIKRWLEIHPAVDQFVILDDHNFSWNEFQSHWVKTSFYVGLTEKIASLVVLKLDN